MINLSNVKYEPCSLPIKRNVFIKAKLMAKIDNENRFIFVDENDRKIDIVLHNTECLKMEVGSNYEIELE